MLRLSSSLVSLPALHCSGTGSYSSPCLLTIPQNGLQQHQRPDSGDQAKGQLKLNKAVHALSSLCEIPGYTVKLHVIMQTPTCKGRKKGVRYDSNQAICPVYCRGISKSCSDSMTVMAVYVAMCGIKSYLHLVQSRIDCGIHQEPREIQAPKTWTPSRLRTLLYSGTA